MKLIKLYLFIFLFIFFKSNKLRAQTVYTSTATGQWTTTANWNANSVPAIPTSANSTTINIGTSKSMTLTSAYTLVSGSVLNIPSGGTLTIVGNVDFKNGSIVNLSTGGVLIIIGTLTNSNNSNNVNINGVLSVTGNYVGGNGSAIVSPSGTGSMSITGSVTSAGSGTIFGSTVDCASNCSSSAANPLPIELIDFYGTCLSNGVQLNWSTASELNNDYFLIEKSSDGNDWKVIAKIGGNGTSNSMHTYIYTDNSVNSTELNYYRMSQVDFDRKTTVFKMIDVNCNNNVPDRMILYPNPASTELNIHLDLKEQSANSIIKLINNIGQIVMETKVDLIKGINSFNFLVDFESGTYTILFTSDKIVIPSQKLLVIRN